MYLYYVINIGTIIMNKRSIAVILIGIFLITNSLITVGSIQEESNQIPQNGLIYVDDDNVYGPWNGTQEYPYQHIQDAIINATDKDIIYVFNGIYNETLIIDKPLIIIGENKSNTIIDGNYKEIVITVKADTVIIGNVTIRNSGGYKNNAGIKIDTIGNTINHCIIYHTKTGIYINNTKHNEIRNCTLQANGEGVFLKSSSSNVIEGCYFVKNSIAIHLDGSQDNLIRLCYLHTNSIAGFFNNSYGIEIVHCNISNNCVNIGGIFLSKCLETKITNCNINQNGVGVSTYSCKGISITNCNFYINTHFAVSMRTSSTDIIISKSEIKNNLRYGIYIEKNNTCKVINNNIENNTLYSIYTKYAYCDARNNWWGSPLGPTLSELGTGSKVTWFPNLIKIFPWFCKPLEKIGADWETYKPRMINEIIKIPEKDITISGSDSDKDNAPDWWEEKWGYNPLKWNDHIHLDPDEDALTNVEECYTDQYGSNPFQKDIFLELDWMKSPELSNKPPLSLINELKMVFAKHNITLHIDLGDLNGGEEIPYCQSIFSFAKLRDLYWDYFLHNNLSNPRKGIFHYGIICNYCPDLNFPFFGWDNFDSFAISSEWLKKIYPFLPLGQLIVGGVVHHLGHSLGLTPFLHGGIDNLDAARPFTAEWWKYLNYKSCMNYFYKYQMLSYSDGSHGKGDFNDWENLNFSYFKNTYF